MNASISSLMPFQDLSSRSLAANVLLMLQSRKWGSVHVPIKPLWWLCLSGQGPWIVSALDTNCYTHCRICRDANVGVSLGSPTGHSSCGTWPSSAPGGWSDWPGWRPQDLGNKAEATQLLDLKKGAQAADKSPARAPRQVPTSCRRCHWMRLINRSWLSDYTYSINKRPHCPKLP